MRGTVFNAGSSLSIGIFFSLMIAGLAASLPRTMFDGLTGHGVPADVAHDVANLPPVGSLFAAFLGYNPMQTLLGPSGALDRLSPHDHAVLTGHQFFPQLMSGPFHHGLVVVFTAATAMTLVGAAASLFSSARPVPFEQPYDAETVEGVEMLVDQDRDDHRPAHAPARVTEVRTIEP
jgi:hypothetical protein